MRTGKYIHFGKFYEFSSPFPPCRSSPPLVTTSESTKLIFLVESRGIVADRFFLVGWSWAGPYIASGGLFFLKLYEGVDRDRCLDLRDEQGGEEGHAVIALCSLVSTIVHLEVGEANGSSRKLTTLQRKVAH